jgi:hypothetical protein
MGMGKGENMTNKKLNILDLMALATLKPELFTKEHLALVLKVKNTIENELYKKYKQTERRENEDTNKTN